MESESLPSLKDTFLLTEKYDFLKKKQKKTSYEIYEIFNSLRTLEEEIKSISDKLPDRENNKNKSNNFIVNPIIYYDTEIEKIQKIFEEINNKKKENKLSEISNDNINAFIEYLFSEFYYNRINGFLIFAYQKKIHDRLILSLANRKETFIKDYLEKTIEDLFKACKKDLQLSIYSFNAFEDHLNSYFVFSDEELKTDPYYCNTHEYISAFIESSSELGNQKKEKKRWLAKFMSKISFF